MRNKGDGLSATENRRSNGTEENGPLEKRHKEDGQHAVETSLLKRRGPRTPRIKSICAFYNGRFKNSYLIVAGRSEGFDFHPGSRFNSYKQSDALTTPRSLIH